MKLVRRYRESAGFNRICLRLSAHQISKSVTVPSSGQSSLR
ncbi:hypothetical protein [Streptomyces pratensis]|nr:hypothetical protein [Streptomyces pratensis]